MKVSFEVAIICKSKFQVKIWVVAKTGTCITLMICMYKARKVINRNAIIISMPLRNVLYSYNNYLKFLNWIIIFRKYILTQGPLSNTVSHFWLMIWEQQSKAVLMLNKLIEKKAEKCYQYWPSSIGSVLTFSDVGLSLEYLEQQDHSYYLTRVLR